MIYNLKRQSYGSALNSTKTQTISEKGKTTVGSQNEEITDNHNNTARKQKGQYKREIYNGAIVYLPDEYDSVSEENVVHIDFVEYRD